MKSGNIKISKSTSTDYEFEVENCSSKEDLELVAWLMDCDANEINQLKAGEVNEK